MTDALTEILAEIDDPDLVEQLLDEVGHDVASQSSTDTTSLRDLYERYLDRRRNKSPSTRAQYKRTIPPFIEFAADRNAIYPSELTSDIVEAYIDLLIDEYDADATILTYTKNVRAWLQWVSKRTACDDNLYTLLGRDDLGLSPAARDEAIPKAEATHILHRLRNQRRGSSLHALLELLWNGGLRIGDVHSLDLPDLDADDNNLRIRHRPEEGTRLKNSDADDQPGNGERNIALRPTVVEALTEYIQVSRPSVRDEYNRKPIFTTSYGRASKSTLRRWVYEATSCRWAANGPVDITCDGSCDPDSDVCDHSYYPHAIRRGSIVAHLSAGLRRDRAAGRFDVSIPILKRHYDPRTPEQRKADREDAVQEAWSEI